MVAVGGNALTSSRPVRHPRPRSQRTPSAWPGVWPISRMPGGSSRSCTATVPQVGNLAIQQEEAGAIVPAQPLHQLCGDDAGSARWRVGPRDRPLCGAGIAVAVVTHVRVDPEDPAFEHPTKPIGPFFSAERAAELARRSGLAGRRGLGTRPSPGGRLACSARDRGGWRRSARCSMLGTSCWPAAAAASR